MGVMWKWKYSLIRLVQIMRRSFLMYCRAAITERAARNEWSDRFVGFSRIFQMANGHGGARPGAGRKPSAQALARRRLQEQGVKEGARAHNYLVKWMDDKTLPRAFRRACALDVRDFIFGKPQQMIDLSGEVGYSDVGGLSDSELEDIARGRRKRVARASSRSAKSD